MTAEGTTRGLALLSGGRRFGKGPTLLARLFAPGFHKLLDGIDRGLETGSITTRLPDGTTRVLGGRSPGFVGEITIVD
jgi:cyclopropane-fatty-acyl-phospholipid synthase